MKSIEEQATGCVGADGYQDFAERKGYKYVEVLDWSISAGDWSFLVIKDKKKWRVLSQENNYPRIGFTYYLDGDVYEGTFEDVVAHLGMLFD